MERAPLSISEIAIIGGTRDLAGAGIGMLLANKLSEDQRRAVGWSLLLVGALTTIPIAIQLFGSRAEHYESSNDRESLHQTGAGL